MLLPQETELLHISGVVVDTQAKLIFANVPISSDVWLSAGPPDLKRLSRHRRNNRLAGQIAAKTLLQKVHTVPFQSITVHHYPSGAPYVEAEDTRYDISISHTASHGIAALSLKADTSVGIDLVQRRDMALEGLIEKTMDSLEYELTKSHQIDFFSLWALKEAALKTWQVGMKVPIWDVHVRTVDNLFQIESDGFATLCGTTIDLGATLVLGVTWGEADSQVKWQPRGVHLGC